MKDIKLIQMTPVAKFSALGLMVQAVGVAQIFVHGSGAARDRRNFFYFFFHVA
jgi:hypothetical protein